MTKWPERTARLETPAARPEIMRLPEFIAATPAHVSCPMVN
jgi:hypothetical protein